MATTTLTQPARAQPSRALNITLWGIQLLLAVFFIPAGYAKFSQPIDALAQQMGWPGVVPWWLVRFIGVAEFLGGLGVVLPAATRIKPLLTPLAALGLATVMLLAALFHIGRGEFAALRIVVPVGGIAALLAWGRWRAAPIRPRTREKRA